MYHVVVAISWFPIINPRPRGAGCRQPGAAPQTAPAVSAAHAARRGQQLRLGVQAVQGETGDWMMINDKSMELFNDEDMLIGNEYSLPMSNIY
jgi:hypothetical protein